MPFTLPTTRKALTVAVKVLGSQRPTYDALLTELPLSTPKPGEVVVRIEAAGFNHRDVWMLKGKYPRIKAGAVFGADGAGVVVASGLRNDPLLDKRVFLNPSRGWDHHPLAPESQNFGVLGGTSFPPIGTFTEYVVVERDHVIPTPEHLDDIHAAAWPVGGVTAWRAVTLNARVTAGQNVLITGIGGGVALIAMQICLAIGAKVFVTSGSQDKIQKAVSLGATGGVNYKDQEWPTHLQTLLLKGTGPPLLDAVIDSAGGDIMVQLSNVLKPGGRVVCYGMTAGSEIRLTIRQVLANQQLIGSTMGSLKDMRDATDFIQKHQIIPIVSHVLNGLESYIEGFNLLESGDQFGKVVLRVPGSKGFENAKL